MTGDRTSLAPYGCLLALLACKSPAPTDPPPIGTTAHDPLIEAVRMGQLRGYALEEGRLQAFDEQRCDELIAELGHCLGNNPTTPYVTAFFDEFEAPFGRVNLDPEQALLFVGRTPPDSDYFSLNAAVHERIYDGELDTPVGSVAPSLHHRVIAHAGSSPFGAPFVAIAAAERETAQRLKRDLLPLLQRAGITEDVVNVLPIPWQTDEELAVTEADPAYDDVTVTALRMGHGPEADRFSFTWRVAGADPSDPFFDGDRIPQAVFRLTPDEPVTHDPWPYPLLPPLRDASNTPPPELGEALRALAERVSADVEARGLQSLRVRFEETTFDGFRCIQNRIRCGNSDDALYSGSVKVGLPDGPADAGVFVVGVVHPDVPPLGSGPPLAYSNLNLQNADEQRALTGWTHHELRGTARARYPGGIDGVSASLFDRLYLREVRRVCDTDDCLPLDALPAGAQLNFLERAYLDLATNTGPHPAAILEPRVVIYGPGVVPRVLQGFIEVTE